MLRQELGSAAELAALVGLAVVQPVLGPFGESPETFIAAEASAGDIVGFAALVVVVPIVVVVVPASATRILGPSVRAAVQTILVGVLGAVAANALTHRFDLDGAWRAAAAVAAFAVAVLLHRFWAPARLFLRFACPMPVLIAAVFLLASPVAPLVRPASADAVEQLAAEELGPALVIVLDELPTSSLTDGEGGIDRGLFPNIAQLADTSTWYRNHTSMSDRTLVSVPSLTTGRWPIPEGPVVHSSHPDNIISLLSRTHDVHAVEWITELCPPSVCPARDTPVTPEAASLLDAPLERQSTLTNLVGEARDLWWEQVRPTSEEPAGDYAQAGVSEVAEMVAPALEFLSGLDEPSAGRPAFDYVHVPLPHQPWRLTPTGGRYGGPNPSPGSELFGWGAGDIADQLGQAARSRHVLQLQWTDRFVGAVMDRMQELGRWDEATVVLTADHGVSFEAGTILRDATPENQADIYWTPLFVKTPHQNEPEVVDDNVMSIDIVPTVADSVGIDLEEDLGVETDGVSLLDPIPEDRPKRAHTSAPEVWESPEAGDMVELDQDLLDEVLATGQPSEGTDELRAWRHGRHGELIGKDVAGLGVCGAGPEVDYEPPPTWDDYTTGQLDRASEALPLWHEATIDAEESIDVAAAHQGTIVAWNVSRETGDGMKIGLLLTEPLVEGVPGEPELFQIIDGGACGLAPLPP